MSHTKQKKANELQLQARAKHRKEFMANIKKFLTHIGHPTLLELLTKTELESIYQVRVHKLKVLAASGEPFPKGMLENIESDLRLFLEHQSFKDPISGNDIPMHIMICEGISFIFSISSKRVDGFVNAKLIKEKLEKYHLNSDFFKSYLSQENMLKNIVSSFYTKLDKQLIWMEHVRSLDAQCTGLNNQIICHYLPCESKPIHLEGGNRPAYRFCWTFADRGREWIDIKPSELGLSLNNDAAMPVYIQNHAFARLVERVGLSDDLMHFWLFLSLTDIKAIKGDKDQHYLIEYRIQDQKVGYFVASIYNGMLIVRTFLFLIYNGTPEGKRLEELSGLQKTDTQYLALTSLSDFLCSDLFENEKLQQLFIAAGCESLLNLYKTKDYFSDRIPQSKAHYIQRYIELGNRALQ